MPATHNCQLVSALVTSFLYPSEFCTYFPGDSDPASTATDHPTWGRPVFGTSRLSNSLEVRSRNATLQSCYAPPIQLPPRHTPDKPFLSLYRLRLSYLDQFSSVLNPLPRRSLPFWLAQAARSANLEPPRIDGRVPPSLPPPIDPPIAKHPNSLALATSFVEASFLCFISTLFEPP